VQDVPPYMIADGNPAKVRSYNKVGLERHGFSEAAHRHVKEAYRLIYRSSLNLQQAVEQIRCDLPEAPEVQDIVAFVMSSPRGIIK
jgi:UDP-N-acetylglucosamine acyltransferase